MNGSIYNNISKEINYKLPDINFDSDSDDFDDGEPVKPFIRPSADILFGKDDSESEEIIRMLSQLPDDSMISSKSNVIDRSVQENVQSTVKTHELPFNNIQLPSSILHRRSSDDRDAIDPRNKVVLSKFGVRDQIDLDKVLEELDMSAYKTSFFDDVLDIDTMARQPEDEGSKASSELLNRLDEISRSYERPSRDENNSNVNVIREQSTSSLSLAGLFDRVKRQAARDTVYLDLRVENALWMPPTVCNISVKSDLEDPQSADVQSSSDDDEDDKTKDASVDRRQGLWIDNYRRAKLASARSKGGDRQGDTSEVTRVAHVQAETVPSALELPVPDDNTEKRVLLKLERIKQREATLAASRRLFGELAEHVPGHRGPRGEHHWPCVLLDEEVSLAPCPYRLVPSLTDLQLEQHPSDSEAPRLFSAFIGIAPPATVLTASRLPSPLGATAEHGPTNLAVLLSLVLRSIETGSSYSGPLPFRVVALHLVEHGGTLQLALLCSSGSSLSRLRAQLKKCTLTSLLAFTGAEGDGPGMLAPVLNGLSPLSLANFVRVYPFDMVLGGHLWRWDNASIAWRTLPTQHRRRAGPAPETISPPPLCGTETACVRVHRDMFTSAQFLPLLIRMLNRFSLAGLRLMHSSDRDLSQNLLVMALRGFRAISTIVRLQAEFPGVAMTVSDTVEDASKDLCTFFGPRWTGDRFQAELDAGQHVSVVRTLSDGPSLYHSLWRSEISDAVLLVSPLCLDVGWVVNVLHDTCGYVLVQMTRLHVTVSMGRQLGIPESALDFFAMASGVCHLLVVRSEHPLHALHHALDQCIMFMVGQGQSKFGKDQLFFAAPYCEALVDILEVPRTTETPEISEPIDCDVVAEPPSDDCEQCSFVLIVSDELTRHVAEVLDQMSSLDLLAVKCFSCDMDESHSALLRAHFEYRLPPLHLDSADCQHAEPKRRQALFVVRSMYVVRELDKIRNAIQSEKNFVFAYTIHAQATFRMVAASFKDSELLSDNRRRSVLHFLPPSITSKIEKNSIVRQLPLIYSPVNSALTVQIASANSVLAELHKLWNLLSRGEFIVTEAVLDDQRRLRLLVERPNAVFFLIQWANCHFSSYKDSSFQCASSIDEVISCRDQILSICNTEQMSPATVSGLSRLTPHLLLMVIKFELLSNHTTDTKFLWGVLEEIECPCIGLSVISVTGSLLFRMREISLRNFVDIPLQQETRYLCLLLVSKCSNGIAERQNIASRLSAIRQADSQLANGVYFNDEPTQIIQCCELLLPGAITKADCVINSEFKK